MASKGFPGANAANFVKTESTHNTIMWVDREMGKLSLSDELENSPGCSPAA